MRSGWSEPSEELQGQWEDPREGSAEGWKVFADDGQGLVHPGAPTLATFFFLAVNDAIDFGLMEQLDQETAGQTQLSAAKRKWSKTGGLKIRFLPVDILQALGQKALLPS